MSLDSRARRDTVAQLAGGTWDLLVIGGGITGVGIAHDAATRGLRVALVEMQDYAAGTSSRSTKLIHGGLRYLKQFELGLVREVGRERAILHACAGHLVLPEQMLLPLVEGGTFGKWGLRVGLTVYDLLAGVKRSERHTLLSAAEALAEEPSLGRQGLRGAGRYSEYRTDDARLVIEVMKTATAGGACGLNHAEVTGLLYDGGKVVGANVRDHVAGGEFPVRAKVVVNAAGPWVDGIRKLDGSLQGKRLHHTKGVHIVVPHARLPLRHANYFDVGDGRMVFAIPRSQWTYIGTTDTDYHDGLAHPRATLGDVTYLLDAANRQYPSAKLEIPDVESSWAGVRPLIHEEGKSASQLSRKDELFFSETGLVTIAGGKLTGFRKMAEKVVDEVARRLQAMGGGPFGPCVTDRRLLSGFQYPDAAARAAQLGGLVAEFGVQEREAAWVVGLWGSNAGAVLALAGGSDKLSVLAGALRYAIRHEGATCLSDFFVRRSALLYFGRRWIEASLPTARQVIAAELGEGHDPDPGMVFAGEYARAVDFA